MRWNIPLFDNIFTTNYDYNLESALGSGEKICHLHGEFGKLAPEYRTDSKYYAEHREECDDLIAKKISGMNHIYTPSIFARTSLLHLQEVGSLQAIHPHISQREDLVSFLGLAMC